nr:unnamed protein product [Digitaria exilis]
MLLPRKLLPWRRPTQGAQTLADRLLRSSSSLPDSDDDPPFTRIPNRPPRAPSNPPPHKPKAPAGKIRPDEPAHSDLPFDFRYSYSETDPAWRPIGFREPTRFSPFGPGRLDRPWDGTAAARIGEGSSGAERSREEVLGEPLSEKEVAELVERYRHSDCSRQINLARNGVYVNVVDKVREAFKTVEVVRLDCCHVGTSDCKKIGVKLRDLVPCIPILFKDEQIILWRGKIDQEHSVPVPLERED